MLRATFVATDCFALLRSSAPSPCATFQVRNPWLTASVPRGGELRSSSYVQTMKLSARSSKTFASAG